MYTFEALQYGKNLHPTPILKLSDDIKADRLNDLTFNQVPQITIYPCSVGICVYSVFKCYFVDENLTCRAEAKVVSKS